MANWAEQTKHRGGAAVDTISELTADAGVTADGVLLKDSQVTTDVINEKTGGAGVTIDGVKLKDGNIEATTSGGIVIKDDGGNACVTCADGGAVTLGPSSGIGAGYHRISGSNNGSIYPSTGLFLSIGQNQSNSGAEFDFINSYTIATTAFKWYQQTGASALTDLGGVSSSGAWTLGPSGYTGTHVCNGALQVTTRNASSSNVAAYFTSTGILSTVSSSIRYKKNVESLQGVSALLTQLRPVEFDYIAEENPTRKMVGLIAEEVDSVIPNMIVRDENSAPDSVFYQDLPIYLLKAFQEQQAMIEALQAKVAALEAK